MPPSPSRSGLAEASGEPLPLRDMSVKRTYTIAEAAEATGLSRKAIARRLERGSLRSLVRNGRRLVPRSELVRAGLLPEEGAAPEPVASPQSPVAGAGEPSSPDVMLAALMRELLDRLERQGNEIASYRAITAQAESLHLEREVGELRARLLALEGRQPGGPPAPTVRPDETMRLTPQPPQPPYPQPPASPEPHGEHPIWLPSSAAQGSAAPPVQQPAPQQRQPVYGPARASLAGRIFLFALEAGFIVAVAVAAWLSDLEPAVIIGSVGLAWLLVAVLEWIRWSARSGR